MTASPLLVRGRYVITDADAPAIDDGAVLIWKGRSLVRTPKASTAALGTRYGPGAS